MHQRIFFCRLPAVRQAFRLMLTKWPREGLPGHFILGFCLRYNYAHRLVFFLSELPPYEGTFFRALFGV